MTPEWVIPNLLAKSARPGRELGRDCKVPCEVVDAWLDKLREMQVKSIICLLEEEQIMSCYPDIPGGLLNYYCFQGFQIAHFSLLDPEEIERAEKLMEECLEKIFQAFQELQKPLLIHCSAGRYRSVIAVNYILEKLNK